MTPRRRAAARALPAVALLWLAAACGESDAGGAADASVGDAGDTWAGGLDDAADRAVLTVEPAAIGARGGAELQIRGTGFRPGVTAHVADLPLTVTAASTSLLTCTAPQLPVGRHDVVVRWPDATERVLHDALDVVGAAPGFVQLPAWAVPELPEPATALALFDADHDSLDDLVVGGASGLRAFQVGDGPDFAPIEPPPPADDGSGAGAGALWPTATVALLGHAGPIHDLVVLDAGAREVFVCGAPDGRAGQLLVPMAGVWTADERLDAGAGICIRAALADADADDDVDLVLVVREGDRDRLRVLRNDGDAWAPAAELEPPPAEGSGGAPAPTPGPSIVDWPSGESRVHVADLDGDGLPDVIVAQPGALVLLRNRGGVDAGKDELTLRYSARTLLDRTVAAVATLDADGDGDLDVIAVGPGQDALLRNDGNARFFDDARAAFPAERAPGTDLALVDVDGDGAIDLLVANNGQSDRFWRNIGGRFVDDTPLLGFDTADSRRLLAADLNDDGAVDLITAGSTLQVRVQNAPVLP